MPGSKYVLYEPIGVASIAGLAALMLQVPTAAIVTLLKLNDETDDVVAIEDYSL
jgi:hypothetical protein